MQKVEETLPDDIDGLKSLALKQQQQLAQQSQFIDQLLDQIRLARHRQFGVRSERFSADQIALAFNEAEAALAAEETSKDADNAIEDSSEKLTVSSYRRARGGRRRLPAELPRIEVVHELDEAACRCESCEAELEIIGAKVSEQLDLIPARVQVLRHVRRTYRCPACEGQIKTAPRPAQPIPKSNASPGTLAHVAIAKYADGRVPRARGSKGLEIVRNFTIDEGFGPSKSACRSGLQTTASC